MFPVGNILSETVGDDTVTYQYDSLNRLIGTIDTDRSVADFYEYDDRGNILKHSSYPYVDGVVDYSIDYFKSYTYDPVYKDKLASYNGVSIGYDNSGNPTNWINGETLTWSNGKNLTAVTKSGTTTNYTYNGDGLRTAKSGGSRNTQYYLLDGTYAGEKTVIDNKTYYISYMYDENGSPLGINRNGTAFYFAKNMQGDVIALLDVSGSVIARYTYDAWGNCTVTDASGNSITDPKNIANCNPFRYRGYMYDQETGLYYLRTRYYDPVVGRFLNADDPSLVATIPDKFTDKNLYTYCDNNPIVRTDTGGDFWETVFDIASLAVSIYDVVNNPNDPLAWVGLVGDTLDLIPFLTGVGETVRFASLCIKCADGFGDLSKAANYGIDTYKSLRKVLKGSGLEAHHIIEQRLVKHLGFNLNEMLSVAVTKSEHRMFTKAWRDIFNYGMDYSKIGVDDIWEAAQSIYKDYPDLLEAARKTLFG